MSVGYAKKFLTDNPNLVIFDIGAYDFADSTQFRLAFLSATIYSFEPNKQNLEEYGHAVKERNLILAPIALSDEDSEVTFFVCNHKYSGSIIEPTLKEGTTEGLYNSDLKFDNSYKVRTAKLDTYCKENNINHIDWIHMDAQGAEYRIMKGLGSIRPRFIFSETCEYKTYKTGITLEIFDKLMTDLGYTIEERLEYDTLYKLNA